MAIAPERMGIGIRRHFTNAGTHPYDEVEWDRRDARITNFRDGTVAFEQLDVEVPTSWSLNATNILAQKYFRGNLASPERESSLRQVVDRVVDTITTWGNKDGYFVDEAEAEAFSDELKHLVINQKVAFNSPVWFNIGVKDTPQQASACQPYDALVSTPDGLVPIGRLVEERAIGTKVYDAHGLTKVVAVKANGRKQVLRVHTKAGHQLDVTADHLVWRASGTGCGAFVEAGELKAGDQLTWHRTESWGDGEITRREIAEAALAGWLQADGFVGQYDHGTNQSLTIEAMTVTDAELEWVTDALDQVFPGVHRHERTVATESADLDCRRTRLYGECLRPFVEKWGLLDRREAMRVPERLFTAPLPVVTAYLRSLFQADGYVSMRETAAVIGLDMISPDLIHGVQSLLLRYGIFSRVRTKTDARPARALLWSLSIRPLPERVQFASELGFVDPIKAIKLAQANDLPGIRATDTKRLEIERVEELGEMDVYDIQTESGEYLSGNLRVHNCFILSVDDTMKSILNWYVEEGTIFQGGSGSGINLSRIRSSDELLKGGGTASGPVSFMRGADASAGTIKSGGKTRRAAKMVILNADHPDIEDFIWCKAIEERKARVLRDAGFDMDLDGKDSHSTQYQNANNSVRVTDEFMQAVVDDTDWDLKAVTTGATVKTVKARELFRQIADATWQCADPGMQFDTTINKWHTAAATGRINASNPCSEYMHLDNSACNLASLNLLKFLNDDGSFDVAGFKAAVEVTFTAQEILVGNADYPTNKIAETSRQFRQLGLGYANLGALLMAQGLPYDSDEGRAWAGAITALMTGHAYATSARTAGRMGPFAGYTDNAEHMNRVLTMHRDEVAKIDEELVPDDLLSAAQEAWEEAVDLGGVNGVRNSQASVLAPTGCLVSGTLVATDRGLVRLDSLGDPSMLAEKWQDLDVMVQTDEGPRPATKFFVNGLEPVVVVDTDRGYRIEGTPQHRIKVVDAASGAWVWRRFADLQRDDLVPMSLHQLIGEPRMVPLPPLQEAYWTGERHAEAPRVVTSQLAELVGYFMGDGSLHSRGLRFCVTAGDLDVIERLTILGKELFNLGAHITEKRGYTEVRFDSVRLTLWWEACGFAKRRPHEGHVGKGFTAHVPDALLETNDSVVYAAFIRGLFEADGDTSGGYPTLKNTSTGMVRDVQSLLLAMGYPTRFSIHARRSDAWGSLPMAKVKLINSAYNDRWLDEIGFMGDRKNRSVMSSDNRQSARNDHIPLTRELVDRLVPENGRLRKVLLMELARGAVSRRIAAELYDRTHDTELAHLLQFFYDRVASAELGDEKLTYDISVPDNVTYVANGFVSHNTIGLLMDCDTTGVEPDLGLCKMKKLVGGGTMTIVNQTVPRALRRLGYDDAQIEEIVSYIDANKSILGAPHLAAEHVPVFACSMGDNDIHYLGHVKMMGAVQPFISGAISKCVTGDTLLPTGDGLVRIGALRWDEAADTFRDMVLEVASTEGSQKTDAFYYGGQRDVIEVTLRSGHRVVGTPNHRLMVAAGDGQVEWRRLDEISELDAVAVQYGSELWSTTPAQFDDFAPTPAYGNQKPIAMPTEMTEELAFLLGAYAAEGHTTLSNWTITITNSVPEVLDRVAAAWRSEFGVAARVTDQPGKCPGVVVSSKTIVEFFRYLGTGTRASEKRIPDAVLTSPRAMVMSFLQGLALDAYVTVSTAPKWAICLDAPALLDDLQAVLTNLGVVHGRVAKFNAEYNKTFDEVYASGSAAQALARLVRFVEPAKAAAADVLLAVSFSTRHNTADLIPGLSPRDLYALLPAGYSTEFAYLCDDRTASVTRESLRRVAAATNGAMPDHLLMILDEGLHFSPVASVADAGVREVFDVSVPSTHAFVGNGIVNHNTVNMPEHVTIEDVEQLHIDAWKLGIKAVAIYRDNCKVAQPLAMAKKDGAEDTAGDTVDLTDSNAVAEERAKRIAELEKQLAIQTVVVKQPMRERLPKRRQSRTYKFRVADCEGYFTVSEYDDGRPGELFLRASKQGSTLAGILDAFSISVSVGLQHGVPLRTLVEKYASMRFEPAGMTDDPELRLSTSIVDYVFRRIAVDYLPLEDRKEMGILTGDERTQPTLPGVDEVATPTVIDHGSPQLPLEAPSASGATTKPDAPLCYSCGNEMQRAGSCYVCGSCGTTSGCS